MANDMQVVDRSVRTIPVAHRPGQRGQSGECPATEVAALGKRMPSPQHH